MRAGYGLIIGITWLSATIAGAIHFANLCTHPDCLPWYDNVFEQMYVRNRIAIALVYSHIVAIGCARTDFFDIARTQ
jgi:hypothetical protein